MDNKSEMSKIYEELIKICEPDTLENDGGKLRARFYLDDLEKKIESEKMLMKDKAFEEIEMIIGNIRRKLF
jgi:hypothetical protein